MTYDTKGRSMSKDDERGGACPHGRDRGCAWCEPCFRKEQRERWGYSPWDYADFLGRANG